MKTTAKKATAVFGAAALATAGLVGAMPAFADEAPAAAEAEASSAPEAGAASVAGELSYTQDAVTGMGVFAKAAAAACANVADYGVQCTCMSIAIQSGDAELIATVSEMMADGEAETHIMGCACSSNAPAGGAVANAEVSGVSLASVAGMVGAL